MAEPNLQLGEPADEADWRALVEKGLKGAPWERLVGRTADGIDLRPLYREPDCPTASEAGPGGATPFAPRNRGWVIRQSFAHPDPAETNREILADLRGGVGGIELVVGECGCAIEHAADIDLALADVILEAAPVSLANAELSHAMLLRDKLKGVAAPGTAFNLDPVGALMREGRRCDFKPVARFAVDVRAALPAATTLRVDARPVHEAGGTEAQEIAAALSGGVFYLRELLEADLSVDDAARSLLLAVSIGPDVLVETAKLRALRLCWARVLEASGVAPESRSAHIHAFTSKRMMTRYDAETNILRVTCAAFAAAIAGADEITTYPFTDALSLPTPFSRRVARNTQHVLLEESRLDHVVDPAGGAWFVEQLTRELAAKAWEKMQAIERAGGIVAALQSGALQKEVAQARAKRQAGFARRKQTITGVTDFPLLSSPVSGVGAREPTGGGPARAAAATLRAAPDSSPAIERAILAPVRWAAPFEALRHKAEGKAPGVFFANLGALADFSPRAAFAQSLFAIGGVAALAPDAVYASLEEMIAAFKKRDGRVAVIAGSDASYAAHAVAATRALRAAGANWILLAGGPGAREVELRDAGLDQLVSTGADVLSELATLHAALGLD